ncbi:hypothetical protein Syun_015287 [Stephania yunnanensis]|uniref:Uncharacterized protein n=1 Tax=Stephania yunnanensis TaxID=152371 RepID=A0AAP0JL20_9MAGN
MAEAVARDKVRDPVECKDRDNDLLTHRGKDMDMFPIGTDFTYLYGRVDIQEQIRAIATSDVVLTYIDGKRQMVHSLRGGRGGAQLVAEEPSPTE